MLILIIFVLILPFIYIKKPVRAKNLAAYDVIIICISTLIKIFFIV